ncbi:uncharacterized protein AMSG_02232 [Thecamonas trahens ATCC 50062]|uniref:VTT domain-containing protein n=1 Tax=Thecamonas trahens ATCC 50062 TaxID=461836 RepID=A0A0L0DXK3_THETB|nr:hypothetical protein AMSG_02232 [Thecamonas trahens ATCC 50062]KNC56263.1 hypothetical protein AMSG_02232 [Thecamonas trahens ATCC 50062]|eukprot:XP_013760785.1 hypothetical protein AMSG_02232 [Thecamonas trahens ATCC 50062]
MLDIILAISPPLPIAFVYSFTALGAAFIYGFLGGLAVIAAAATVGTVVSIAATRLLLRDWLYASLAAKPTLASIVEALNARGFVLTFVFRLAPLPYGLSNGILAVARLPYPLTLLAALGGSAPKQIMLAVVGSRLSALSDVISSSSSSDPLEIFALALQMTAALATMVAVSYLANKSIASAVHDSQRTRDADNLVAVELGNDIDELGTGESEELVLGSIGSLSLSIGG